MGIQKYVSGNLEMTNKPIKISDVSFLDYDCQCAHCRYVRLKAKEYMRSRIYPTWICTICANGQGAKLRIDSPTKHEKQCDICYKIKTVTHIRNYGYPDIRQEQYKEKDLL